MIGTKQKTLGTVVALAGVLLLAASVAQAEDGRGHRGRSPRVQHQHGGAWVPPAPPVLPRSRVLPRPHLFTVPHVIRSERRHAYAPYFVGTVYYEPLWSYLDVYYFPVRHGASIVYEPYYYFQNQLFYTTAGGGPRFFLHIDF